MPHVEESVTEAVRALDTLKADGVVLLANHAGTYVGEEGQDNLFAALDERSAVVFIHPADLAGPTVPGVPPYAVDFLLDTTRAAYLLVRNGIRHHYPNIKFILSHAGGFVLQGDSATLDAVNRTNALALFPRLPSTDAPANA